MAFPACCCAIWMLLLFVGGFIFYEYWSHVNVHVKAQNLARNREKMICAFPEKVKELDMFNLCHKGAHDLEIEPEEYAEKVMRQRYSLDGWIDWSAKYYSKWAAAYIVVLFVLLKPFMEWAFNKVRTDYHENLIPT